MASHRSLAASSVLFLVPLALSTLTGCDLIKKLKAEKSGETTTTGDDTSGSSASAPKGKATAGCEFPADGVNADFTLKKGCTVTLKSQLEVRDGATLTIEPGTKILVEQGNYIWVYDGKLVAKGTAKEPIVLTTANKTPAPGDWVGIGFEDKTQAGSVLDFVHIDYAGSSDSSGHGAVELLNQHSPGRVTITNTQISHSAQSAVVDNGDKGGFAKFEKNTFTKNKNSLEANSRVLGTVGAGNVFSDPLIVGGNVAETTTWPAFDAPVVVKDSIEIGGTAGAATLTIAPKTTLKFSAGTYMSVGTEHGGSLIANGVTFTSENATPHPGDWIGLFIYDRATNVQLEGATFEYAGADASGGQGAITFYGVEAKKLHGLKVSNITFRKNAVAAISSPDHDCATVTAGNKSEGVPLCRPE